MESIKYIAQNQRDREWGLAVCSVGHQKIAPGEEYPPNILPKSTIRNICSILPTDVSFLNIR